MSYIEMEQKQCPICGVIHKHKTGILLGKRLKDIDPEKTITGRALCEEHDLLWEDGFVALVVVTNTAGNPEHDDKLKFGSADRTGDVMHMQKNAFCHVLGVPDDEVKPMVFIDTILFNKLKEMVAELPEAH